MRRCRCAFIYNPQRWYLVYRNEKSKQSRLALFREWLLAEIAADETLLPVR